MKGFVGKIQDTLEENDIIHVLNIGGVAGICISENINTVGNALKIKVIGAVSQNNKALNIKQGKLFDLSQQLISKTPLIVVSGTCMNVGKTCVACEIISHASKYGFKIH